MQDLYHQQHSRNLEKAYGFMLGFKAEKLLSLTSQLICVCAGLEGCGDYDSG